MAPRLFPHRCLSRPAYRLYRIGTYGRWLLVGVLWLTLMPWTLWQFRGDIELLRDYFTWAGLRYSLAFQWFPTSLLIGTIAVTGAVLVRESIHLLWGLSLKERDYLHRQTAKIRKMGHRHPLWRWIF